MPLSLASTFGTVAADAQLTRVHIGADRSGRVPPVYGDMTDPCSESAAFRRLYLLQLPHAGSDSFRGSRNGSEVEGCSGICKEDGSAMQLASRKRVMCCSRVTAR